MTAKAWSDKSEWITNCPICFGAVSHQYYDYHLRYHETEADAIRYYSELIRHKKENEAGNNK